MAIYYVKNGGDDAKDGLSEANAWEYAPGMTSYAGAITPAAGDSILFNKGDTWREQLTVPSSGSSGSPITFGAYGSGNQPIINSADLVTTWSVVGATKVYSAACNWTANLVFEDSVKLTYVTWDTDIATTTAAMSAGTWTLDTVGDLIYVWTTDELDPDTHIMDVGTRNVCIDINGKSYITFQDLSVKYANDSFAGNINEYDTTGITLVDIKIHGCTSSYAFYDGIKIHLTHNDATLTGLEIYDNTISNNGTDDAGYGIFITANASGSVYVSPKIYRNACSDNIQEGIRLERSSDGEIYENTSDTDGHGSVTGSANIMLGSYSVDTKVYRNYCIDPGAENFWVGSSNISGIEIYYNICIGATTQSGIMYSEGVADSFIYNNSIYNTRQGISIGENGQCTGITVKNNISDGIIIDNFISANASTYTIDYNCWDENKGFDDNGNSRTWAQWQSAGFDVNGFYQDPIFTLATNADFTLHSTSPCINAGTDVGLSTDYIGTAIVLPPDIGAYEYIPLTVHTISPSGFIFNEYYLYSEKGFEIAPSGVAQLLLASGVKQNAPVIATSSGAESTSPCDPWAQYNGSGKWDQVAYGAFATTPEGAFDITKKEFSLNPDASGRLIVFNQTLTENVGIEYEAGPSGYHMVQDFDLVPAVDHTRGGFLNISNHLPAVSVYVETSKGILQADGYQTAVILATVFDKNNNRVDNQEVYFEVEQPGFDATEIATLAPGPGGEIINIDASGRFSKISGTTNIYGQTSCDIKGRKEFPGTSTVKAYLPCASGSFDKVDVAFYYFNLEAFILDVSLLDGGDYLS